MGHGVLQRAPIHVRALRRFSRRWPGIPPLPRGDASDVRPGRRRDRGGAPPNVEGTLRGQRRAFSAFFSAFLAFFSLMLNFGLLLLEIFF